MALLLVVGFTTTSLLLTGVGFALARGTLDSSRRHVSVEAAVHAAEQGLDQTLARVRQDKAWTCGPAVPAFADQPPRTASAWAAVTSALADGSCPLQTTTQGTFLALRPPNRTVVFSYGSVPVAGAEVKKRLLKAEYIFVPYAPSNAILTAGGLEIGSGTTVTSAPPADPDLAQIHSNGNITVSNGNPTVYGEVSQSGGGAPADSNKFYGNAGGTVTNTPKQSIPPVSAASVWAKNHDSSPPGGWYDLCADGSVRSPDGATPCSGTVLADNSWRGWAYNGSGAVKVWTGRPRPSRPTRRTAAPTTSHGGDAIAKASSNPGSDGPNFTVIALFTEHRVHTGGWEHQLGSHRPGRRPRCANLFMPGRPGPLTSTNLKAGGN